MLRASSVGLTSAFPSTICALRLWKASCSTRTVSGSIQKAALSYSLKASLPRTTPLVLLKEPPSVTDHATKGNEKPMPDSRRRIRGEHRPGRLRVKVGNGPGSLSLLEGDADNVQKTVVKSNPRLSQPREPGGRIGFRRSTTPRKPNTPKEAYRVDHSGNVRNRAPNAPRKHASRIPYRPHPKIESFLRTEMGGDMGQYLLGLLRTAASGGGNIQNAWKAYAEICRLQTEDAVVAAQFPRIPNAVLHRLSRHIASSRPITKSHFPRLLSLMQRLWDSGQHLPIEAWNTLINFAGKGHRTGTRQDYDTAASIFRDMVAGQRPGTTFHGRNVGRDMLETLTSDTPVQPDLITFNTLLNIAARSLSKPAVKHAVSLLSQSGLTPDYITHMCLLVYHNRTKNLNGVRATLKKMADQNLPIPIDGVNAVMTAYAFNNRTDVVLDVFRLLKNNASPEPDQGLVQQARNRLKIQEHIQIVPDLRPDVVTYTLVIQTMAHSGDFFHTFSTLHEFISSPYCRSRIHPSAAAAFRGIFLGFSKHATSPTTIETLWMESKWNLANLQLIYELFLEIPILEVPTRSTLYWIMVAFDKASGQDIELLQQIWLELKSRYEPRNPRLFSQPRLRRLEDALFSRGEFQREGGPISSIDKFDNP